MLLAGIKRRVEAAVDCRILRTRPVGGGCIAHASRLETDAGPFFLKWVDASERDVLRAEAAGLAALAKADCGLIIPAIVSLQLEPPDEEGILVMQWIETGEADGRFWDRFGAHLAALHRFTASRYGFDADNFIGRLAQSNAWTDRWPDFFRERRLRPQAALARRRGCWEQAWQLPFDRLLARLDDFLPHEPTASILHGDLWSGNFLATPAGTAALVDPATYFGHRETDLALTELFGGYDARFYSSYRDAWPLEPGYPERRECYNLYHLLNHLNHFGDAYASSVDRVLQSLS